MVNTRQEAAGILAAVMFQEKHLLRWQRERKTQNSTGTPTHTHRNAPTLRAGVECQEGGLVELT